MRFICAIFALLCLVSQAVAQVPLPQTVNPPNVPSGLDANGKFTQRQLNFTNDLLFPPPFGISASSSNAATIEYGQVVMYPDFDPGFAVNQAVQITSPTDPQALMVGVITAYSNAGGMTTLTVDVEQLFGETATLTAWNIQVIGMPSGTIPRSAGWSIDYTDSFALPVAGASLALTVGTGKGFIAGAQVYVQATLDATTYVFGVVKNYNSGTGALNLFVTQSSGTGLTYQIWTVSMTGNLGPFVPILGFSGTSLTFGSSAGQIAQGSVVTMTTQTGLLLNNSHIVVSSSTDSTQYFRGIGQYNSSTGAITIWITDSSGSGTITSWSLFAQDGPPVNANQIAVSKTSITLGAGDFTFTIQAGQNLPIQGPVTLTALADPTKQMLGVIKAYSGTSLIVTVTSSGVYGSGTFTAWSILNTGPPQTRISLNQRNGLVLSGANTTALKLSAGSMRDQSDTVDIVLPNSVTIAAGNFVAVTQSGTVTENSVSTITGSGTSFSSAFSTTATLTDLNTQFGTTLSFPSIITVAGDTFTPQPTINVASNTVLSVYFCGNQGGAAFTRGGSPLLSAITLQNVYYGVGIALKDSDGSVAVFLTSFTISGAPDLPSGYTYYRMVGYASWNNLQWSGIVQPSYSSSPLTPKAVYSATITPTLVVGSISAVNTSTEVITWSQGHVLITGQSVRGIGTVPTGFTVGQMFYVNALSGTTFALYTTLANALADTSRVDLTTTTTGATMVKLVYSNEFNVGFNTAAPIAGTPGSTTMHWDFNYTNATASNAGAVMISGGNIFNSTPAQALNWQFSPSGLTWSTTTLVTYSGNAIGIAAGGNVVQGLWSNQGTTGWNMSVWIWGALDESVPANDNDMILRAVA